MGSNCDQMGLDWATIGTDWALLGLMGPQLKYVRVSKISVVSKCRIHCKNNAFGTVRQKHENKSSKTYVFFCRKLFSRCSRLHGSAATLTNPAACAQHESVAGGRELSSHAYSDKICVFGTRHGSRGSHRSHRSGVKNCGSDPHPTRAGGQDDVS